jgi:DNA ligase (NAD+)
MDDRLQRIKYLTELLNNAAKSYYSEGREILPNIEYDKLYDELAALENETGVVLAGSPTSKVGYEVMSELPKEEHAYPMLSLDKTKDPVALAEWLGDKKGLLSWKLDGLTIAMTFRNGELFKAVTRGNGQVGEVVTSNARVFVNLPLKIPYKDELVIRGEAVISYSDFDKINEVIEDIDQKYKNPRNLCSGSVRQLNSEVTAGRRVRFFAFSLVSAENHSALETMESSNAEQLSVISPTIVENLGGEETIESSSIEQLDFLASQGFLQTESGSSVERQLDFLASQDFEQTESGSSVERQLDFLARKDPMSTGFNSREGQLNFLEKLGFQTVEHFAVFSGDVEEKIRWFSERVKDNDLPSDGLVLNFDDVKYSESLGQTSKFPKDSIAFKWQDEQMETSLLEIEWSASRTGLINPIAVFEPVELEGTTVSRASVHNISIMEELNLGLGDRITVYKANMIIPQIADNLTRSGSLIPPEFCPVCGHETTIKDESGVRFLYCLNVLCLAKRIKSFTHFVGRDAMNIEGLSESSLEKFIAKGFIHEPADLFHLDRYQNEIIEMEGFGNKSYNKLQDAIEKARSTTLVRVLYSLGVPGIGLSNAKLICKAFDYDFERIKRAAHLELIEIDGVGDVMATAFVDYFNNSENLDRVDRLIAELKFAEVPIKAAGGGALDGMVFVITGNLEQYENRNALKEAIEVSGGKVTGSVSAKTSYLINNDTLSSSNKNKTAKELGVPIISEDQIKAWIENGDKP